MSDLGSSISAPDGASVTRPVGGLGERALREQRRVLGHALAGAPVDACLDELCRAVERLDPTVKAAVVRAGEPPGATDAVAAPTLDGAAEALRSMSFLAWSPGRLGSPETWREACAAMNLHAGLAAPIGGDQRAGFVFLGVAIPRDVSDWDAWLLEFAVDLAESILGPRVAPGGAGPAERSSREAAPGQDRRGDERFGSLARAISSVVWTSDAEGRFVEAQPSWTAYCGIGWEELREHGCERAFHPEDRERLWSEFESAKAARRPYVSAGRVWHAPSGSYRRFEVRGVPVLDPGGSIREWVGTLVDVEDRRAAEDTLRRNEARYRAIVEGQTEMVCRFRIDGTILFANEAYARGWGVTARALEGANLWAFIHPEDQAHVRALLGTLSPESPEVRIENRVEMREGTRWTLWSNRALAFDELGKAIELQSCGIDITDRKSMEDALRESEERFRVMADAAPVMIWVSGASKEGVWFNTRWLDFVGRSMEQEVGHGWAQSVHPDDLGRCVATCEAAFAAREAFSMEFRLRRRDGEYRWVLDQAAPRFDASGRLAGFIGSCTDITERRAAEHERARALDLERAARAEAETLNRVNMTLGGELDLKKIVQAVTDAGTSLTGAVFGAFFYNVTDERGESFMLYTLSGAPAEAFAKFPLPRNTPLFNHTFRGLGVIRAEDIREHPRFGKGGPHGGLPPGHLPVVSFLSAPVTSRSGEVIGGLFFGHPDRGVFTERAERVAMGLAAQAAVAIDNARLHESVRRAWAEVREIADTAPAMLWTTEPGGSCSFISRGWCEFTGQSGDASLGRGWLGAIHPDDRDRVLGEFQKAEARREAFSLGCRVRRADGEHRRVVAQGRPRLAAGGAYLGFVGSVTDVHERTEAEAALRESEERFRALADNIPQLAWMTDAQGRRTWFNRRWHEFTGTSIEQVRGDGWRIVHHPDHLERVEAHFRESLRSGREWEDTFPLRGRDGRYRWFLSRAMPIRDESGVVARWFGTNTDITERLEVERELARHRSDLESLVQERTKELRETYERLRISERLAMMGTLSAGLGHDMGNLLLPLRVRLDSLAGEALSERAREDVEAVGTAAEYLRRLAGGLRLLAVDPKRASRPSATALAVWWSEAEGVLRSVLPRGVSLEADIPGDLPDVAISKAGLTQVVFNLVQNAGDAMRERVAGRVLVRARPQGDGVGLEVSDDGPGMTPEVRARCMEPFFTTKAAGLSTGLGLALVHSLVRDAGGRVEIESRIGAGSLFTLHLPVATPGAAGGERAAIRRAVIRLADRRMRAFVLSELRALGVEVIDDAGAAGAGTLFVVDGPDGLRGAPDAAPVLAFGAVGARPGPMVTLPPRHGIAAVRAAVRRLVVDDPAPNEPGA